MSPSRRAVVPGRREKTAFVPICFSIFLFLSLVASGLDLNSICAEGGTFFPGRCGPLSSCHRCYYLGKNGQSCDDVCADIGSTCDATGTSALGSLGDSASCYAVADAMGIEYTKSGTYVGEPVGCAWIGNYPDDLWVQRMVDATKATSCIASDPGRSRICSCETSDEVAPTTLLSDDGGQTCLDLDGDGNCGAFALIQDQLVALPDAELCVGVAEDDSDSFWKLVPCEGVKVTRFSRVFDRYVSDIAGTGTLDRFSEQCAPLDLGSIPGFARPVSERGGLGYDLGLYDQSECFSVEAGENCEVACLNGFDSVNFRCPDGNVDPSQQPLASHLPLCASNRFIGGAPSLYGVPTSDSLRVRAVSALPGRLWVVVAEWSVGVLETGDEVKRCKEPYCSACKIVGAPTEDFFFHELVNCDLVEGAYYRLHFYVSSDNSNDVDGSIATYEFQVPTMTCPVAIEPERVVGGETIPAGKQNGRYFWGSCYYVAGAQESCDDFCQNKLSGASCDVPGLLVVGSCAQSVDSCVQLVQAMGLPFDEKVGTYGDDSSGCTWYHGSGGANAEFWVQRFIQDRDPSNPTTCGETNGDDSRHRICSCTAPNSGFGAMKEKSIISIETGLIMQKLDAYALQNNAAAMDALEKVFLDLTGVAIGDVSTWIIDAAMSDRDPTCESLVPELDITEGRRLDDASKVWVYVGANSAGDANHIQLNINTAVESGELVHKVADALSSNGISVAHVQVAGTTPQPTAFPTLSPTGQPITRQPTAFPTSSPSREPSISFQPTTAPPTLIPTSVSPTASPTFLTEYKSTGNFVQEFLFESKPLSQGEQSAFEEAIVSLTPLFASLEKPDIVRTSVTMIRQTAIADPDSGRRSRFLFQESSQSYERVLVQYIVNYVSKHVIVSDYPLMFMEFLSLEENKKILDDKLTLAGVPVVPGSSSSPLLTEEQERDQEEYKADDTREEVTSNSTAVIVGVVVGVVCIAIVALGAIIFSRKNKKAPVVEAVPIESESDKSSEILVVEAFAVDDVIARNGAEDNLHLEEEASAAVSHETTSVPDAEIGSSVGVARTDRVIVHVSHASAAARREEVRNELVARKVAQRSSGEKRFKKYSPPSTLLSNAVAAPRAQQSMQGTMPKGPEVVTDVSRHTDRS